MVSEQVRLKWELEKLYIEQERRLYRNLLMLYIKEMLYNDQKKLANIPVMS